jgi:hypothetical protein
MKSLDQLVILVLSVAALHGTLGLSLPDVDSPASAVLRISPINPRYFTDGSGKAIYLTGSHTWTGLIDRGDAVLYLKNIVSKDH